MKKFLLLMIITVIGNFLLHAQTEEQMDGDLVKNYATQFSKSPEAASFERYGFFPVNESTGVPNVKIPLSTVSSGKLTIPVFLSYHMGGNKVNDISSSVGLGWTLNYGGMITRTIRGRADENGRTGFLGEFASERPVTTVTGETIYPVFPIDQNTLGAIPANGAYANNSYMLFDYFVGMIENRYDNLSDLYSFNIPGNSGSFVYDTGRNLVQIPESDCNISRSADNKFTITDDKGVRYLFSPYEYTYPDNITFESHSIPIDAHGRRGVSTWLLEYVISEDKADTISFTYIPHKNYEDATRCFIEHNDGHTAFCGTFFSRFDQRMPETRIGHKRNYSTAYTREYLISTITFKDGRADFVYKSGRLDKRDLALSNIIVKNNAEIQINKVMFTQDYFYSGTIPSCREDYRLKLDEITIYGSNGDNRGERYGFIYNQQTRLPRTYNRASDYYSNRGLNYGQDHWGYYNGITTNTNLIGVYPDEFNFIVQNTNREPSERHMKAGILEKINYPTGGNTVFITEANRVIKNGSEEIVGGLRIAKIISTAEEGLIFTKTYKYENAEIVFQPDHEYYRTYMINSYAPKFAKESQEPGNSTNYSSHPISSIGFYMGSPVIYKTVSVYDGDYDENIPLPRQLVNGKVVYNFHGASLYNMISPDQYSGGSAFHEEIHIMPEPVGWQSGQKLSEKYYKLEGGRFGKVRELQYHYDEQSRRPVYTGTVVSIKYNFAGFTYSGAGGLDNDTRKFFYYYWLTTCTGHQKLTKVTDITYSSPTDSLMVIEEYKYDNIRKETANYKRLQNYLVTEKKSIHPDGRELKTIYKYPQDYVRNPYLSPYDTMLEENMLSYPVEVSTYADGQHIETKRVDYNWWNIPNRFIKPFKVETRHGASTFTRADMEVFRYDSFGNQQEVVNVKGVSSVYLWGYKGQYLIAEIKNATYAQLTSILSSDTINNISAKASPSESDWVLIDNLRTHSLLSEAVITTCVYEPMRGICKMTDGRGVSVSYTYDYAGRLSRISDDYGNPLMDYKYNYMN